MPNISHNLSIKLYDFNVSDTHYNTDNNENNFNNFKCNREFCVEMFGISETGRTASLKVTGFRPFFYVKVPDYWDEQIKTEFTVYIRKRLGTYYEDCLCETTIVKHHKLYWFDNYKLHKFVMLKFTNTMALNKIKQLFYQDEEVNGVKQRQLIEGGIEFLNSRIELYEAQIPPLLKLFHIKSINPAGWILLKSKHTKKRTNHSSNAYYNLEIEYNNIIAQNKKEESVKYNILSYDIEASSSHGDFPVAKKDYKKLAMDIIQYYNKLDKEEQELFDSDKLYQLITSAFIDSDINDININKVFTKQKPSLESIKTAYDKILRINLKTLNSNDSDNESDNNIEDDSSSNSDNDNDNDNDNSNSKKPIIKYKPKLYTNINIVELIKNKKTTYKAKIRFINRVLTKNLPQLEGDTVTFIGMSFINYGSIKPHKKIIILKGGCIPPPEYSLEDNNLKIISLNTEREVLLRFTKIVKKNNPHFVIGYNINGFDFDFLYKRSKELDCEDEFLKLSFNNEHVCKEKDWKTGNYDIEKSKILLASGEYNLKYIKMPGRVIIDLYNVFRREHQLTSYKLDYTSSYFISDDVIDYTVNEKSNTTCIYSKNLSGLTIDCYVKFEEISYSTNQYCHGKKFKVLAIDNSNSAFIIDSCENFNIKNCKTRWGLAKDDVSPQEIFKLSNGSDQDRWIVAKYCIADCDNVIALLMKNDIITGYVEMARLCSVPLSFLFNRGQGIKLTSYVSKKAIEKNTLIPVLKKSLDDSGYEGAHVFTPKTGLYLEDPVACVDYSSLYPSSIISENISHDSKVWTQTYNLSGELIEEDGEKDENGKFIYDNLEGFKYVDIQYDTYQYIRKTEKSAAIKQITGYKICRFAQYPEGKKAILPSILEELLLARKTTRRMIPNEKDEFMKNVLDKRQLSIKLTANSVYGQAGAKTGTFYEKDVAASTTATGRKLLFYARSVIEECYNNRRVELKSGKIVFVTASCVYGDTDSVFFKFDIKDDEDNVIKNKEALEITIEVAQLAGNLATKFLKPPHDLEYEKTFWPFCLLTKKRYDGMLCEFDVNKCKLKSMGNVLKRRDNAAIVKDIYGGVINILMKEKNLEQSIKFVRDSLDNIVNNNYNIDKLVVTKSLRGYYKNPKQIAHNVLAERIAVRDPGNKPGPGDRINYVYIVNTDKKSLQGDRIDTPEWITNNNLDIDINHYISNQIMKPLQQLFALELENIIDFKKRRGATLQSWYKEVDKLREKWKDPEKFAKKLEELKMKEIKILIFDDYLKK